MTSPKHIRIPDLSCGNDLPLVVIAGPCQLETLDHALMIGERMAEACRRAGAGFVFKASYDKANRSAISSYRGLGVKEGCRILAERCVRGIVANRERARRLLDESLAEIKNGVGKA